LPNSTHTRNKNGGCGNTVNHAEEIQGRSTCKTWYGRKDRLEGYHCSQGTGTFVMGSGERMGSKPECVQPHMATRDPNTLKFSQKYRGTGTPGWLSAQKIVSYVPSVGGILNQQLYKKEIEIYCKGCHAKNFVPKGLWGKGKGAGKGAQAGKGADGEQGKGQTERKEQISH
uniref:Uncharacterized protein n=1 Tax=Canis lupus dingo TaxID=286419 RepID=A0A8C0L789_CANLU